MFVCKHLTAEFNDLKLTLVSYLEEVSAMFKREKSNMCGRTVVKLLQREMLALGR